MDNTLTPQKSPRDIIAELYKLNPEDYPDVEPLVIEDDQPVDNIFAEKQQRLLTESLYSCWQGPEGTGQFLALANVGLFFAEKQPALAPDVMLAVRVEATRDLTRKENRSYLMWVVGKPPDVVIELVSDHLGGEETHKRSQYAQIGIPYYAIFDPRNLLKHGELQVFGSVQGSFVPLEKAWFPRVGLGLTLWEGTYEQQPARWLRWCDERGAVIPTGRERADKGEQDRDKQRQRADKAEQERNKAEQERDKAEQERDKAEQQALKLAAKLRELGIDPEG